MIKDDESFDFECGMYNEFYKENRKTCEKICNKNQMDTQVEKQNKTSNSFSTSRNMYNNTFNRSKDNLNAYLQGNIKNSIVSDTKNTNENLHLRSKTAPSNDDNARMNESLENMNIAKPKKTYGMRNAFANQNFEIPKQTVQSNAINTVPGIDKKSNIFIPGISKPNNLHSKTSTFVPNANSGNVTAAQNKMYNEPFTNKYVPNANSGNVTAAQNKMYNEPFTNKYVPNANSGNVTATSNTFVPNLATKPNENKPIIPPKPVMSIPKVSPNIPQPITKTPSSIPKPITKQLITYPTHNATITPNVQPSNVQNNSLTETEKQKILESIITKIKYLQEVCSTKKGVLIRNKISSANKRLEYFKGEMNCGILKELECLFSLISIEELKEGNMAEIKNKIYDNFRMISEDICKKYEGETSVWLPGVVGLLQVVLSDSK